MKTLALGIALTLACGGALAQDMRPGIASIAVVTTEPEGLYGMDGDVLKPAKLKRYLVALDDQMAIGHLHLRRGGAEISPERLAEVRALATAIGAQLMVEKDGRMEPDAPSVTAPGD